MQRTLRQDAIRDRQLYFMLAVPIVVIFVFCYVPMWGILMAFQDYNLFKGVRGSKWVGFEVFTSVFHDKQFWSVLLNTIRINLLLLLQFPFPLVFALLLNEMVSARFKRVVQSVSYLPHFMSWVIVYGLALAFLAPRTGWANALLRWIGASEIPFLTNKGWWLGTFFGVNLWKEVGWGSIIYIAAITSIDPALYEAASIDGAGRLQRLLKITIPSIRGTIVIMFLMAIAYMVDIGFEAPYLFGNVFVRDVADVLSTYIYDVGVVQARFSYTTAVGLFQSMVNIAILLSADFIARSLGQDGILYRTKDPR